jgi:hypothetical protein
MRFQKFILKIFQQLLNALLDCKPNYIEIAYLNNFQLFEIPNSTAKKVDHAFQIKIHYILFIHLDIQAMETKILSLLMLLKHLGNLDILLMGMEEKF